MRRFSKLWKMYKERGLRYLIQRVMTFTIRKIDMKTGFIALFSLPYILYKNASLKTKEAVIRSLFNDKSFLNILFYPSQIEYEINILLNILRPISPNNILEIGTARGGSLLLWTRIASEDATIISIDLPGGSFGGGYPLLRKLVYSNFGKSEQKIILIRGNSHDSKTLEKVKCILQGSKLDFLFIDGDHSYEGVKKDFEMYSPLVRKGGIIAFHDIVPHDRVHDPYGVVGVHRFWNEIKHSYKYLEIVKDWGQGWAGIGVLYV